MRQFIFASEFLELLAGNETDYGKLTIVEEPSKGCHNFVLKRDPAKGGDILYPFYAKDFTVVKAAYSAAKTFTATLTIGDVNPYMDYTVIFTKKGLTFNERCNWTASVHTTVKDTPATVAAKIALYVNKNTAGLGLKAEAAEAVITFTAVKAGADFAIKPADELLGTEVKVTTKGAEAFMDAKMVKDLFAKCAADAGFEYTYDELEGLYPNLDFNPLAQPDNADTGFDVVTVRFTEPRVMGTREEAVYQIIQIALPTGKGAGLVTALEEYVVDVR